MKKQVKAYEYTFNRKEKCSIVLPPPNITGRLHMGHAFQQTLMDILAKYNKLLGIEVEWYPGTDHAGIAGQMTIEKNLLKEGIQPASLTKAELMEYGYKLHKKSSETIRYQMQRLGLSIDWTKERFTMDSDFKVAVKYAFVEMYKKGMLYRKNRIVFWDTKFKTAISDSEVVYQEKKSSFWYIRFPLINSQGTIIVATTRPETLFGDVALAVNPNDIRYSHLIGQSVLIPIINRIIVIVADESVDPDFGTGCVKITPGHSFDDFILAQKHELPIISILDMNLLLNDNVPDRYIGLSISEARIALLKELTEENYLEQEMTITHKVPTGDRSGEILEPIITKQWFVKSKNLAPAVVQAVLDGEIHLHPESWNTHLFDWIKNMEDWCVSRQVWWGHRIPAWYDEHDNIYVGNSEDEVRLQLKDPDTIIIQDNDVLDTWFTAALWPLAIRGWPAKNIADLDPHTYLVTGFDILFFWIIRMTMITKFFTNTVPAKHVIITGLIRDAQGRKMSKTVGNVIDPLDIIDGISLEDLIEKQVKEIHNKKNHDMILKDINNTFPKGIPAYGTDVLRLTFAQLSTPSVTASFDFSKLIGNNAFINKIINASRFTFLNLKNYIYKDITPVNTINIWIINKLIACREKYDLYLKEFRFDLALKTVQEFIINFYCDWYIEFVKCQVKICKDNEAEEALLQEIQFTLLFILHQITSIMYPLAPFMSQNIYAHVNMFLKLEENSIENVLTEYYHPIVDEKEYLIGILCDIINAIRSLNNIHKSKLAFIITDNVDTIDFIKNHKLLITSIAKIDDILFDLPLDIDKAFIELDSCHVYVVSNEIISLSNNQALLLESLLERKKNILHILNNVSFMERAPKDIVQLRRRQLNEINRKIKEITNTDAKA